MNINRKICICKWFAIGGHSVKRRTKISKASIDFWLHPRIKVYMVTIS